MFKLFTLLLLMVPFTGGGVCAEDTPLPYSDYVSLVRFCDELINNKTEDPISPASKPLPTSLVYNYIPNTIRGDIAPSLDIRLDGKCTSRVESFAQQTSHWCKFNRTNSWPSLDAFDPARRVYKFGRLTVYNGPIMAQKFACNVDGIGSDRYATVALSTRYLKTWQGGWNHKGEKGGCGRCVCVTLYGGDSAYNAGIQHWVITKFRGLSFMGKVGDRMGEGADNSIDILLDRPFSYAWTGPENPNSKLVNNLKGLRGFTKTNGSEAPHTVGTWTALWNFVPCSWTHENCAKLARNVTSNKLRIWTPTMTPPLA